MAYLTNPDISTLLQQYPPDRANKIQLSGIWAKIIRFVFSSQVDYIFAPIEVDDEDAAVSINLFNATGPYRNELLLTLTSRDDSGFETIESIWEYEFTIIKDALAAASENTLGTRVVFGAVVVGEYVRFVLHGPPGLMQMYGCVPRGRLHVIRDASIIEACLEKIRTHG